MKNLNPLYLTEDKVLDKELRDAVRTHNNAKKVFKNKFNSYKNGPTFWDFEKLKSSNGAKYIGSSLSSCPSR